MFRSVKKNILTFVEWVLYRVIKTEQKERLAKLFTDKQKAYLKKIVKPGKKRTQLQHVERVKKRLNELGFEDRALKDMENKFQSNDPYLSLIAGWQLAVWYANQDDPINAKFCIDILQKVKFDKKDHVMKRRKSIIEAECYQRLGETIKAKDTISKRITEDQHADLLLAKANLEEDVHLKLQLINQVMDYHGNVDITLETDNSKTLYDNLTVKTPLRKINEQSMPKVTIIIPAYNAETIIETSVRSILQQTWKNIEVIIADDCSSDETLDVVRKIATTDTRVKLVQTKENGGAYVARNVALQHATGDFVTINDADDWSHPEKIATQVQHLIAHPKIVANFSQQVRMTNDFKFYRRGKPGIYVFPNMSSFMFRKKKVLDKLGYWDSVRFAGDSEFVKRTKLIFGEKAVVELDTGPLSFQRQTSTSLTGDSAFGFPGFFMGVRKEYAEVHEDYHRRNPDQLYYSFPQEERPFPVPEPMWPKRAKKDKAGYRHFDVIIASEFRLLGGTNMSNAEEIKAQTTMGLKTGLVQLYRYELNSVEEINPHIRELVDGEQVQFVCYGEKVTCDVLIVRHPPILQDRQKYVPTIDAKNIKVIINQPPKREYSKDGQWLYDFKTTARRLEEYFGKEGKWYPIGPVIREALLAHHETELSQIKLSDEDWVNIINVDEWRRTERPNRGDKIRIGRHSRSQYVKWPSTKETILEVYPDKEEYEIHVLGGADVPKKILGSLPSNWHVYEFGDEHPRDFLATLDVFVYYTHPDWIEAFGRVIFEAMAVGVPVIIPPNYRTLFGEAAIYAEPNDVESKIKHLMSDKNYYEQQVNVAQNYVESHFGYTKHVLRLELNSHV